MSTGTRIILTEEDDWWVAEDEETGVTSQGRTPEAALANLDEALDGFRGRGGANRRGAPGGGHRPTAKRFGRYRRLGTIRVASRDAQAVLHPQGLATAASSSRDPKGMSMTNSSNQTTGRFRRPSSSK